MKCLCCGKEIKNDINYNEWHCECIKKFFGTNTLPIIDLSSNNEILNQYAFETLEKNQSVTGVQKKLSIHLSKEKNNNHLTITGIINNSNYIIKFESNEYKDMTKTEHLVMLMANECGIKTPAHALLKMKDETYAYIVKRMDRVIDNSLENDVKKISVIRKIHIEDFCQLSLRPTEYKYISSYEKCAKVIDKYSDFACLDKIELFKRLVFCYITGNSDMHLKNFSLIETSNDVRLSDAYDLLPVNILIKDEEEMALSLNGKKKNITYNDFIKYAITIGLEEKTSIKIINRLIEYEDTFINMIIESNLLDNTKKRFSELLKKRVEVLKK